MADSRDPNSEYSFGTPPRRQNFVLPPTVISYLARNPLSPDGLLKLQKSCKLMFLKSKILIVDESFYWKNNSLIRYSYFEKSDRRLFPKTPQFWLLSKFIHCVDEPLLDLKTTFYRCDVYRLSIEHLNLTLNEISFLLSGGKVFDLNLSLVEIRDSFGTPVSVDTILAMTPRVERVFYLNKCETFSTETFENLTALKFESKIEYFILYIFHVSGTILAAPVSDFFKKNHETELPISFEILFTVEASPEKAVQKKFKDDLMLPNSTNMICDVSFNLNVSLEPDYRYPSLNC